MTRLRQSLAKTAGEVAAECPAWAHGCVCHACRIRNGKPEPSLGSLPESVVIKHLFIDYVTQKYGRLPSNLQEYRKGMDEFFQHLSAGDTDSVFVAPITPAMRKVIDNWKARQQEAARFA